MAGGRSTRLRQVALAIENDEGTAETLNASHANILVVDGSKFIADATMIERKLAEQTLSLRKQLRGCKWGIYTGQVELKGSGAAGTAPGWWRFLQIGGMKHVTANVFNIATITGGPFQHGEIITGGTSGATGRVIGKTADGAAKLYYIPVSQVLTNGETVTGGTSGATVAVGSVPTGGGRWATPDSTAQYAGTLGSYEDGVLKRIRGARAKLKFNLNVDAVPTVDVEVWGGLMDPQDASLLSGITHEATDPVAVLEEGLTLGTYSPEWMSVSIDSGAVIGVRRSGNAPGGIRSFRISDRAYRGELDPESDLIANKDFIGEWMATTEQPMQFEHGTVAGNRLRFCLPKAQILKVDDGDREKIATSPLQLQFNRQTDTGDDEFGILHY